MNDYIEINQSDLEAHVDKLRQISDNTETLVDINKAIFVKLGIPLNEEKVIIVPDSPHIFIADQIHVKDRSHPEGATLNNVTLLIAHGIRDAKDTWRFKEGQSVVDTVKAYNEYAKKENLPNLEFIIACNDDPTTKGTGVQIHDFDFYSTIAHAVGEVMNVQTVLEEDGRSIINVQTDDDIVNLDNLIASKEVVID